MIPLLTIWLTMILGIAWAEPLRTRDSRVKLPKHIPHGCAEVKTGITQNLLNQFDLLAQYAGAAYCYDNIQGKGTTVACTIEGGYCPTVEAIQPVIVNSFFNVGITKTAGYVAIDQTNQLIIVSIQGTSISSNPIDVLTDLEIERDSTSLCGFANSIDSCSVHHGFWQASNDVLSPVNTSIYGALDMHPNFRVVTTGHSLGGAVAALLGAQLRNRGYLVDIVSQDLPDFDNITKKQQYTFGQPSLGGADVSNYIQNQAPAQGNNYRITHYNDVVPQLPEHDWGNWDHYYPEFWISKETGTVGTSDMLVVTGSLYETSGNEGQRSKFGVLGDIIEGLPAHDLYFNTIDGCKPEKPSAVAQ